MAGRRTVNLQLGLPPAVTSEDPKELRRVLNRVLEILRVWNGEAGNEGDRLVKASEQ